MNGINNYPERFKEFVLDKLSSKKYLELPVIESHKEREGYSGRL